MSANIDVYQKITDQIVAQLNKGNIPWQKTWNSADEAPRNFVTKKPYRGINIFLLGMSPFSSPYWMTYKQAAEAAYKAWLRRNGLKDSMSNVKAYQKLKPASLIGDDTFDPAKHKGGVRKGEKSTPIVFWKILKFADATAPKGEKTVPLLRYYNVFNVEQMDGLDLPERETVEPDYCHLPAHKRGDGCWRAEDILAGTPNPPSLAHGGNSAHYVPSEDHIQMPPKNTFFSDENYYATRFHELVHATGHKTRLNRPDLMKSDGFGTATYSQEELVAEMGAAMLCGVARIDGKVIDNQAAYIKGWLKRLQDDPKLIVSAAGQAQRAADYVLGVKFNVEKKDEEVQVPVAA
jgi:antirestriction protein ArdC